MLSCMAWLISPQNINFKAGTSVPVEFLSLLIILFVVLPNPIFFDVDIIYQSIGYDFYEALLWLLILVLDIGEGEAVVDPSYTRYEIEGPGCPPCGITGILQWYSFHLLIVVGINIIS